MTTEQFSTMISLLPEIEKALNAQGDTIPRPIYEDIPKPQEEEEAEHSGEDHGERGTGKLNFEATSEEE